MLALMCNIYLGEDFIPTNRPDVYKKCALLLFERWDRNRRISTAYGFENHLSPIMTHIAHWLYTNPGLQSGVTEQQLVEECARYLHKRRYEHLEEAQKGAADFIEFCRGRAWVFSDTGVTPSGENLYQFTHRTFLEYFAAQYLFRTHPKPSDLLDILLPRIAKREWDVVAQLAFHIAGREVEGGGDFLMDGVTAAAGSRASDRLNLLNFAGRCLEFISCSPKTGRSVADATLSAYLAWCFKTHTSDRLPVRTPSGSGVEDMIANLLHTGLDSRNTMAEAVERFLCAAIQGTDEIKAALAAEIAVTLPLLVHRRSDVGVTSNELIAFWHPIWDRITSSNRERLGVLGRKYLFLARAMQFTGVLSIRDLAAWHGTSQIFRDASSSVELQSWPAVSQALVYHLIWAPVSSKLSEMLVHEVPHLEMIGQVLLTTRPPWTTTPDFTERFVDWILEPNRARAFDTPPPSVPPSVSSDALFGGFAIFASSLEAIERTKQLGGVLERMSAYGCHLGVLSGLSKLLLSRISTQPADEISAELASAGWTPEQSSLAARWSRREVNFVRHHGKKAS